MKRFLSYVVAAALSVPPTVSAQEAAHFSVATLNVDGLPQKILVFNVNADGPGVDGSLLISKYLRKKNYDIVCMQEDFNYHAFLIPWMVLDYQCDEWTGAVGLDVPGKKIDFFHLQNEQFECDGLGAFWKDGITVQASERVPWKSTFGKFSHALDELVTKGFRRTELTLADGTPIIVYNMHMDASALTDAKEGVDHQDRAARLSEWRQLRDDVLAHLDTRPIIIMGDLNSYYGRDQVKAEFIDKIAESGRGTASDVWVELGRKGEYPAPQDGPVYSETQGRILDGETLDKIIYINPAVGTQLKAVACGVDTEGYQHDGKPIGDHYPLTATFEIVGSRAATGISTAGTPADGGSSEYYNMRGQRVAQPTKGLYIEQRGQDTRKRIIK